MANSAALGGLTVLDLTTCFADFGATVVLRDPHPIRAAGPFDDAGNSIPARAVLSNKSAIAMDSADTRWRDLAAAADVVVDSAGAGTSDRAWIDTLLTDLDVVHVVVTPHGLTGRRAGHPGNDLTAAARSGWASVNGLKPAAPLKPSGYQASYQAGTLAFAAAVSALVHRQNGGPAQQVDVAVDDVSVMSFGPGMLRGLYYGAAKQRRSEMDVTAGPVPVKNGYFALTITRPHFWQGAARLLGLDDLAADPRLQANTDRNVHKHLFVARLQSAMMEWSKSDLFKRLSEIPVVAGPVFTMSELLEDPHLAAREYFAEADGVAYIGAPFVMSKTPFRLKRGMPCVGADTDEFLAKMPEAARPTAKPPKSKFVASGRDGPLTGYRGVVLTQARAGTLCTQLLPHKGGRGRCYEWKSLTALPLDGGGLGGGDRFT